jgi:hypothetical protein
MHISIPKHTLFEVVWTHFDLADEYALIGGIAHWQTSEVESDCYWCHDALANRGSRGRVRQWRVLGVGRSILTHGSVVSRPSDHHSQFYSCRFLTVVLGYIAFLRYFSPRQVAFLQHVRQLHEGASLQPLCCLLVTWWSRWYTRWLFSPICKPI